MSEAHADLCQYSQSVRCTFSPWMEEYRGRRYLHHNDNLNSSPTIVKFATGGQLNDEEQKNNFQNSGLALVYWGLYWVANLIRILLTLAGESPESDRIQFHVAQPLWRRNTSVRCWWLCKNHLPERQFYKLSFNFTTSNIFSFPCPIINHQSIACFASYIPLVFTSECTLTLEACPGPIISSSRFQLKIIMFSNKLNAEPSLPPASHTSICFPFNPSVTIPSSAGCLRTSFARSVGTTTKHHPSADVSH